MKKKTKFILNLEKISAMICYNDLISAISREDPSKLFYPEAICDRLKRQKKNVANYYDDEIGGVGKI